MSVPFSVRDLVVRRAGERCEYCRIVAWPLSIDHIVPVVAWNAMPSDHPVRARGLDHPDNLAAACGPCNRAKSGAIEGYDGVTETRQPLFDPRRMRWEDHFEWRPDHLEVIGLTAIGRATAVELRLNRQIYRRQRALLRIATLAGGPRWP